MAPRMKTLMKLFKALKKEADAERATRFPPKLLENKSVAPPSSPSDYPPPSPLLSESSTGRIKCQAVEEYLQSTEFDKLMTLTASMYSARGFYFCKRWISSLGTKIDVDQFQFNTIPDSCVYTPKDYLKQVEENLLMRRWEANAEEDVDDKDEKDEEQLPKDLVEVDADKDVDDDDDDEDESDARASRGDVADDERCFDWEDL